MCLRVLAALSLGDEQLDALTDQQLVLLPGDLVDELGEAFVAVLHDVTRHLLLEHGGGGTWSLGVLEGERAGEPRLLNDGHRLEEVLLGLTGKADNDVGRDRGVWHSGTDTVDDAEVLR